MYYYRKNKGISICTVWYEDSKEQKRKRVQVTDYNFMLEEPENVKGFILSQEIRSTLFSDLTKDEDNLISEYEKNLKYDIRRAERENYTMTMLSATELSQNMDIVDEFCEEYITMYSQKGMKMPTCKYSIMESIENNNICMSIASLDGNRIVYHVYLLSENTVRLLHSISTFRDEDAEINPRNIGRGNKWLHHKDMVYFKERGYKKYDWGGYSHRDELEGIDIFKKKFGGVEKKGYYLKTTTNPILYLAYKFVVFLRKG